MKDYKWFHVAASLASKDFSKMDWVLSQSAEDCFAYMDYSAAYATAEGAQDKYIMDKNKRGRR